MKATTNLIKWPWSKFSNFFTISSVIFQIKRIGNSINEWSKLTYINPYKRQKNQGQQFFSSTHIIPPALFTWGFIIMSNVYSRMGRKEIYWGQSQVHKEAPLLANPVSFKHFSQHRAKFLCGFLNLRHRTALGKMIEQMKPF